MTRQWANAGTTGASAKSGTRTLGAIKKTLGTPQPNTANIGRGNSRAIRHSLFFMSANKGNPNKSDVKPARDRWNDAIVPAARGLESFFWKLAWFVVFLALLFGGECRRMLLPRKDAQ